MKIWMTRALIGTEFLRWILCSNAQFPPRILEQPTCVKSSIGQPYTITISCSPATNVSFARVTLQQNTRTPYYTTTRVLQLINSCFDNPRSTLVRARHDSEEVW